jgi:hypothetical protein
MEEICNNIAKEEKDILRVINFYYEELEREKNDIKHKNLVEELFVYLVNNSKVLKNQRLKKVIYEKAKVLLQEVSRDESIYYVLYKIVNEFP